MDKNIEGFENNLLVLKSVINSKDSKNLDFKIKTNETVFSVLGLSDFNYLVETDANGDAVAYYDVSIFTSSPIIAIEDLETDTDLEIILLNGFQNQTVKIFKRSVKESSSGQLETSYTLE